MAILYESAVISSSKWYNLGEMSETEEGKQRVLQSSFGTPLESHVVPFDHLHIPQLNTAQFHAQIQPFSACFNGESNGKRVGMPPLSPGLQNHKQTECLQSFTLGTGPAQSRSSSQQPLFYAGDSLPPLSPSSYHRPVTPVSDHAGDASLHSRKTHRRSNSDIPFGFSTILQSSPPLIPSRGGKGLDGSARNNVKRELSWEKTGGESNGEGLGERKPEGEVVDDWLSSYMNLNNLGKLNSFRTEAGEDLDSRVSGTKANGGDSSDNEATSSVISDKREGVKRSAGGDIAPTTRHYRSVSMDSVMAKTNFVDDGHLGKLLSTGSLDVNSDTFSLEIGNGVFNGAELKKIMANENLAEMALTDPKRVKRILANRLSAARSKERKMRYIAELENKVQTLQTEATKLSSQITLLQRDLTSLTSQNNELKFRLQAMEQQAHLRDALNDNLTAEVQRLKMMRMELNGDATNFSRLTINPQVFQLQQEQEQEQDNGTTTHEGS